MSTGGQAKDTNHGIIFKFIVLAVLAGQLNSGYNAAWVFCFLALDPHWKHEVRAEIDRAIAKHRTSPEQKPIDVLGNMDISAWENDFSLINLCLHESIRIVTVGAGLRKNISNRDVTIGHTGEVIPKGAFAAFHIDQIHMNPTIYTNPTKFDPGRFLPGREEDKKAPLAYAGWGLGRHPCCEFFALISGPFEGNTCTIDCYQVILTTFFFSFLFLVGMKVRCFP